MNVRTVIVDDERLAREKVRTMLTAADGIEIVGEAANGAEAMVVIKRENPDLIFLDVQMPGMSGFDVLRKLHFHGFPIVVFITAYDEYAVKAFEVEAIDYILKPFDRKRFNEALARARRAVDARRGGEIETRIAALLERVKPAEPPRHVSAVDQFVVKVKDRMFFISPENVDWISAEGKYVRLHVGSDSHLLREAIGDLERRLEPRQFLRIHRGTIVNVRRIREMYRGFGGDYFVILTDGTRLSLSRRYRARLRNVAGLTL